MGLSVVLRRVKAASYVSPPRTRGGRPLMICKSCVTRTLVLPVPKQQRPDAPDAAATAAWAAVHGVASLASRGVLDLVGTDAQKLLDQMLPQD